MLRSTDPWILPADRKIPDFIICGAMKCGTTTLHYILNQHPQIHIPDDEVNFFDMDNLLQHADFNYFDGKQWLTQKIEENPEKFWDWYTSQFAGAEENQMIGEDSTTYIASECAAERIRGQHKTIKLIVTLRHPTSRAYSQYWHMLRSGRATYSFEDTIRYDPFSVLQRSLYAEQLKNFLRHIPQDQVKVVIFEEFLADKQRILHELCDHIGVDSQLLPTDAIEAHKNQSLVPKYPAAMVLLNRFLREAGNRRYRTLLPVKPKGAETSSNSGLKTKIKALIKSPYNPLITPKPPKIKPATKVFLDDYFKRELKDLNAILGRDVLSIWFD